MSYVDIIFIGIIILGTLIGLWRGVGKALIKFVCFAIAVLTCFLISDYCLKFLLGVDAIRKLALGDTVSIRALIGSALDVDATGVVKMLYSPLIARYADIGGIAQWGATEEQFLSVAMSLHAFTVLMTVILYFAAKIVANIIGYALRIIFVHGTPGIVSRILGAVVGAVKSVASVGLILFVISIIFPFSFAKPVTDGLDGSKVASAVCSVEYDFLSKHLYGDEILSTMMSGAGFGKTEDTAPETPSEV